MLEVFQLRVYEEKKELDEKISKLNEFLSGDGTRNLALEDLRLLSDQFYVMNEYSRILDKRIRRFNSVGLVQW